MNGLHNVARRQSGDVVTHLMRMREEELPTKKQVVALQTTVRASLSVLARRRTRVGPASSQEVGSDERQAQQQRQQQRRPSCR